MSESPSIEPLPFEAERNLLVVAVDEIPAKVGSIFIPETVRDRASSGVVLGAGPEAWSGFTGRRIAFAESSGVTSRVGERSYLFLDPTDVLVILPEGTPAPYGEMTDD